MHSDTSRAPVPPTQTVLLNIHKSCNARYIMSQTECPTVRCYTCQIRQTQLAATLAIS